MVMLALETENGAMLTYRLSSSHITVGSSSKNDVVVRSPGVAERHLVIHRNGDVFTFVTGDRLTVVLNGERRARGLLNPGDKIRFGGVTLVFRGSGQGVEAEGSQEGVHREAARGRGTDGVPARSHGFRRCKKQVQRDPRNAPARLLSALDRCGSRRIARR